MLGLFLEDNYPKFVSSAPSSPGVEPELNLNANFVLSAELEPTWKKKVGLPVKIKVRHVFKLNVRINGCDLIFVIKPNHPQACEC